MASQELALAQDEEIVVKSDIPEPHRSAIFSIIADTFRTAEDDSCGNLRNLVMQNLESSYGRGWSVFVVKGGEGGEFVHESIGVPGTHMSVVILDMIEFDVIKHYGMDKDILFFGAINAEILQMRGSVCTRSEQEVALACVNEIAFGTKTEVSDMCEILSQKMCEKVGGSWFVLICVPGFACYQPNPTNSIHIKTMMFIISFIEIGEVISPIFCSQR